MEAMYYLLEKPEDSNILGVWSNHIGKYTEVVGYTTLGSIILHSPDASEYLVLHPRMQGNNAKQYGKFSSIGEFEEKILKDSGFHRSCITPLSEEDVESVIARLGALEKEECFYPCLDPSIGGSGKAETFDKGNVWVSADISGQNRGLS